MADLQRLDEGAKRAAEAVLRASGARSVLLRRPRPGAANDVTEQLGLATATFDDVELAPAVLRLLNNGGSKGEQVFELLVSARAITTAVGTGMSAAAVAMLEAAAGVIVDGALLRITRVSYRDLSGVPYVYRLELTVPVNAAV